MRLIHHVSENLISIQGSSQKYNNNENYKLTNLAFINENMLSVYKYTCNIKR